MKKTKISVIIPVYNMGEYIEECLDSVINQTLTDIEIICVDDCSTDNSAEIIKSYANNDLRIKYKFLEKNSGSGMARNVAIDESCGEFLIFIDPDDLYKDYKVLEKLYEKAKEKNVKICGGNLLAFDNNNIEDILTEVWKENRFTKEGFCSFEDYHYPSGYIRFIFDSQLIKENNVKFPNYKRRQDPVFFVKAMTLVENFYAIEDTIYLYRLNHKKIDWNEESLMGILESFNDTFSLYNQFGYWNHYAREYLDLIPYMPIILKQNSSDLKDKLNHILMNIPFNNLENLKYPIENKYRNIKEINNNKKIIFKIKREIKRAFRKLLKKDRG